MQDLSHDVFTQILKGLSGAKVTRPGKFRSSQDGYSVRASLKAEEGTLYPLEKSFFFLPKPPTLILHDEVHFPSVLSKFRFVLVTACDNRPRRVDKGVHRRKLRIIYIFVVLTDRVR